MKTKWWGDFNRNHILAFPLIEIALYKNDFSLWLEFKWLDFSIGLYLYNE